MATNVEIMNLIFSYDWAMQIFAFEQQSSQRFNWEITKEKLVLKKKTPSSPPSTLPSLAPTGDDTSSRAQSHEGGLSIPFAAWQALYEQTDNKLLVVEAVVATRLPWMYLGGQGWEPWGERAGAWRQRRALQGVLLCSHVIQPPAWTSTH